MSRQSKSTYKTHLNSFAAEMFNEEALRAGDDSTKVSDGAASGGSLRAGESIDVSRPPVVSNPEEEDNGTWWGEAMRKSGRAVNAVNFLTGSARTKVEPTLIPLWKHSPDSTEENPVGNPDDDGAGVDLDDMLTDEDEAGAGVDLDDMMSDSDEDEAGVLSPKGPQVAGYQRDLQNSVKAKGIFGFLGKSAEGELMTTKSCCACSESTVLNIVLLHSVPRRDEGRTEKEAAKRERAKASGRRRSCQTCVRKEARHKARLLVSKGVVFVCSTCFVLCQYEISTRMYVFSKIPARASFSFSKAPPYS